MFEFLYGAWLKCFFNRNQSSLKITCFRGKKQSLMTAQWDRWLREEHNVMGRIWWYLVVLNSTRIPCSLVRPRASAYSIKFWLGTGLAVNGLEFDYWPRGSGNAGLLNLFDVLLQFYLPLSLTFSLRLSYNLPHNESQNTLTFFLSPNAAFCTKYCKKNHFRTKIFVVWSI